MEQKPQPKKIPFNIPFRPDREMEYIKEALESGELSGNGRFTRKCQRYFEKKYGFQKCFLTHSCTGALEMSALLLNINPGDEVIIPSYTFVTSASAFALRGATVRFCDSLPDSPHIDPEGIRRLVNEHTKAIVIVHYAGVSCDMDAIMEIVGKHGLYLVEDAAHGMDAYHRDSALGSFGHLSTFSFHNTKNISSGEGGMLAINDEELVDAAEIIWEKGTNRAAFFRGDIPKYEWITLGSSFSPSELVAAYLWSQLEHADIIIIERLHVWEKYYESMKPLRQNGRIFFPELPDYANHNAHIFYLVCRSEKEKDELYTFLKNRNIQVATHYLPLHESPYFKHKYQGAELPNSQMFCNQLIRLPLFPLLDEQDQNYIIQSVFDFFQAKT